MRESQPAVSGEGSSSGSMSSDQPRPNTYSDSTIYGPYYGQPGIINLYGPDYGQPGIVHLNDQTMANLELYIIYYGRL